MNSFGFGGGDIMFSIAPIFIGVVFVIVLGVIIFTIVSAVKQWDKNNKSPILNVDATIVAKRIDVSRHKHNTGSGTGMSHTSSSTRYYVTFQVESGDRIELQVKSTEYGFLVEGDQGELTFQGTRYKRFERP